MIDAVIEELKTHQTQLDQDGVMVGVSRQALEELLAHVAAPAQPAPIAGLEPVAWGEFHRGKLATCRPDKSVHCAEPLYTRAQLEANAAEQVRAERKVCAKIADDWRVSEINNGDLTNEQLNQLLNGIGPNIAAAICARGQV